MEKNTQTITAELCQSGRLVFYPKTEAEAIFIQKKLFERGCGWGNHGASVSYITECVNNGILVEKGRVYHTPDANSRNRLCDLSQFGEEFDPGKYLPPDQSFMLDQFNKLAARLAARVEEIGQKVDHLHENMFPQVEDTKRGLRRPGGSAP